MKEISQEVALARISSEFSRRGWSKELDVARDIVRAVVEGGGYPNLDKLMKTAPGLFLVANGTTRATLRIALERALAECCIRSDRGSEAVTHVYGDHAQILVIGRNEHVKTKKIQINNQGQFAGNVDSPEAKVKVRRQQQAVLVTPERLLREQLDHPEVREIMVQALPAEKKGQILGSKLAKLTGVAVDVATDFAAKLVAEMIKPR